MKQSLCRPLTSFEIQIEDRWSHIINKVLYASAYDEYVHELNIVAN